MADEKAPEAAFDGTITLATGKIVKIHELNGLQQAIADSLVPNGAMQLEPYFRAAAAIDEIAGQKRGPVTSGVAGLAEIQARLQLLTGSESDELMGAYQEHYGPVLGNELKNLLGLSTS
jgi:hypothetical protein